MKSVIVKHIITSPRSNLIVDHRKVVYHAKEKDAVDSFEKNFNEIRTEFKVFAAK